MKHCQGIPEMRAIADDLRRQGKRIGLVPTMGYLHAGHQSLIRLAREHADTVITTVFVNPTQFAPDEDFTRYPRDLERDSRLAMEAGNDILFVPDTAAMYPEGYQTHVTVDRLTSPLEGKSRPTHFRGVTTVVAKLLLITKPHCAVFGQKDAQQALVVRQMVRDLDFGVDIIIAPIVREPDGLAMSSRNVYLSPTERAESIALVQSLRLAEKMVREGRRHAADIVGAMTALIGSRPSARIDYISVADSRTLAECETLDGHPEVLISLAVRFGRTRLIDNIILKV